MNQSTAIKHPTTVQDSPLNQLFLDVVSSRLFPALPIRVTKVLVTFQPTHVSSPRSVLQPIHVLILSVLLLVVVFNQNVRLRLVVVLLLTVISHLDSVPQPSTLVFAPPPTPVSLVPASLMNRVTNLVSSLHSALRRQMLVILPPVLPTAQRPLALLFPKSVLRRMAVSKLVVSMERASKSPKTLNVMTSFHATLELATFRAETAPMLLWIALIQRTGLLALTNRLIALPSSAIHYLSLHHVNLVPKFVLTNSRISTSPVTLSVV